MYLNNYLQPLFSPLGCDSVILVKKIVLALNLNGGPVKAVLNVTRHTNGLINKKRMKESTASNGASLHLVYS